MASGQNLLAGKKRSSAPEFICGQARILANYYIVQPHHMVNCYGPKFNSGGTMGTIHVIVSQHGAYNLDDHLDFTFGNVLLMSRTSATKANVLVLFN